MVKASIKLEGMGCTKCEVHVNNAIKKVEGVKKVSSSFSKNFALAIMEDDTDIEKIKESISEAGYKVVDVKIETKKKSFLEKVLKK